MTEKFSAMEGECRCGQVQFQITAPPLITAACHCRGCQKMSASAFSLSALIPAAAFSITRGEPVIGGLRGSARHYFCPHCMSWMFTRPEGLDEFVNIRITMLSDPAQFPPFMETFTSEKLDWATTGATYSYGKFPEMQDFEELTTAYAAHARRSAVASE